MNSAYSLRDSFESIFLNIVIIDRYDINLKLIYALENVFLLFQCIIRLLNLFFTSYPQQVILYNYSMFLARTNIFNLFWARMFLFGALINYFVYFIPKEEHFMFIYKIWSMRQSSIRQFAMNFGDKFYRLFQFSCFSMFLFFLTALNAYATYAAFSEYEPSTSESFFYFLNMLGLTLGIFSVLVRFTRFVSYLLVSTIIYKLIITSLNRSLAMRRIDFVAFWKSYVYYVRQFHIFNDYFGFLFFCFLCLYTLIHTYSSLWILNKMNSVHSSSIFFGGIVMLGVEMLVTIYFHYIFAQFSKSIHGSNLTLISIWTESWTKLRFRKQLLLSEIIQKIHTQSLRVSFTYGSFGMMSLLTFGKYIFIYFNLLLKCYKLQQLEP